MNIAHWYPTVTLVHQYLSWALLLAALFAMIRGYRGWILKKRWAAADTFAGTLLTILADLQLVAGILLYAALSPITRQAFTDFGAAMQNPGLRFYAVEHIAVMILAILFIHIGRSGSRKAQFKARKHKLAASWFTLALALMATRIPWDRIFT